MESLRLEQSRSTAIEKKEMQAVSPKTKSAQAPGSSVHTVNPGTR